MMNFDPENPVNKLCAEGIMLEGEGKREEAARLYYKAWETAVSNAEKFTAAHYVARVQEDAEGKLAWDHKALGFAVSLNTPESRASMASLYLNVAKGHEDLGQFAVAATHYESAREHASNLQDEGYGRMIRSGIEAGLGRVRAKGESEM